MPLHIVFGVWPFVRALVASISEDIRLLPVRQTVDSTTSLTLPDVPRKDVDQTRVRESRRCAPSCRRTSTGPDSLLFCKSPDALAAGAELGEPF